MGPFHWTVWLALIAVYLGSIPVFTYSDKLTLRHLMKDPLECENMFWYVFGTFTNSFTFSSKNSWTRAEKGVTKFLVGNNLLPKMFKLLTEYQTYFRSLLVIYHYYNSVLHRVYNSFCYSSCVSCSN